MTRAANLAEAAGSGFAFRNRIINGDMRIDQRNAGAAFTGESYVIDRWRVWHQNSYTKQQVTDAPPGFKYSLKVTKTDSLQSTWGFFVQYIEGANVADLGFGTANAATVTLSFWVKASMTGAFTASLSNSAENRSYALNYTINSANTWEYKTLTFPGDTSGTWLTDTGKGIAVQFNYGSNNQVAAPGSWNNVNAVAATGSTNFGTTNGATFQITGVQLEKGSVATPFENRLYGAELALCQRYYQTGFYSRVMGSTNQNGGTAVYSHCPLIVPMRATPSMSASGTVVVDLMGAGTFTSSTYGQPVGQGTNGFKWDISGLGGSNLSYMFGTITNAGITPIASAEL